MYPLNKISIFVVIFFLTGSLVSLAQSGYTLSSSQEFKVTGTSTLHDWEMLSEEAKGQAIIKVEGNEIKEIQSLKVILPVKTLKSGNNRMDRTAYDAIEANRHEEVIFEFTGVRNITPRQITVSGNLTLAGTTRPVTLQSSYNIKGNSIHFTGKNSIKFSQFEVSPPTALLGTVRTGDELGIAFDASFNFDAGLSTSAR